MIQRSLLTTGKVAIVYDQLVKWGGAERLIQALVDLYPQADIITPKYKASSLFKFLDGRQLKTSFLSKFPFKYLPYQLTLPLNQIAIESFNFNGYKLVISLGATISRGIITNHQTKHLHYALASTRYLWQDYKLFKDKLPSLARFLFSRQASKLRLWDYLSGQRPDKIISISNFVSQEIKKYYRRDSKVIMPAFNHLYWRRLQSVPLNLPFDSFWLSVARLVPQKRLDLSIQAAAQAKKNLVIVGAGWLKNSLIKLAGKNKLKVLFLTNLSDSQLKYLYQKSQGLIMPQREDFGLAALEACCFYKPIIFYRQGGAGEFLKDYPLAWSVKNQTSQDICQKLKQLPDSLPDWPSSAKMDKYFQPFSIYNFKKQMSNTVSKLINED